MGKSVDLAKCLVDYVKANGAEEQFRGSIDYDVCRPAFRHGKQMPGWWLERAAQIMEIVAPVPALRFLTVHGEALCNAGAYIYQEPRLRAGLGR